MTQRHLDNKEKSGDSDREVTHMISEIIEAMQNSLITSDEAKQMAKDYLNSQIELTKNYSIEAAARAAREMTRD